MDTTPQIALAEKYINTTSVSLFLTGKAGTGKTTFLRHIVANCKKRHVVIAPTGVAAVNAGGVTIHSFFQLPFDPYLPDVPELKTEYQMPDKHTQLRKEKIRIIRTLDLLIIDEISMVRADLLDAIDYTLRRYRRSSRPFGGVQLLMIGDVQQLPPVVTESERPFLERVYPSPFFFHSKALHQLSYLTIELTTIFRQNDAVFVGLLNNIRDNKFDETTLRSLNSRHIPNFTPPDDEHYIRLTTHNHQAERINQSKMDELPTKPRTFKAIIQGNFSETSAPTSSHLVLKEGAQVMFVKNDPRHQYYNGKIGIVTHLDGDNDTIVVSTDEGTDINVGIELWENIKYDINPETNQIEPHVDGTFSQYPLRPAWAITIHKAQGLTFDKVIIDAASAFAYGQVYVALSRCRTLEGLVLSRPISPAGCINDEEVFSFVRSFPDPHLVEEHLEGYQSQYYYNLIDELFELSALQRAFEKVNRIYYKHLRSTYPQQSQSLNDIDHRTIPQLMEVSEKFRRQLHSIQLQCSGNTSYPLLHERVGKAARYFLEQLETISAQALPLLSVEVTDKQVKADLGEAAEQLAEILGLAIVTLKQTAEDGFTIEGYQRAKVEYQLRDNKEAKKRERRNNRMDANTLYASVAHPELVPMLTIWRKEKYTESGVPAFQILTQKTLMDICDKLPTSLADLAKIKGIGKTKVQRYGHEILEVIEQYCSRRGISATFQSEMPTLSNAERANDVRYEAVSMFASGASIHEIAEKVSRAEGTVEGYVMQAIQKGIIEADSVLDYDEQDILVAYFIDHPEAALREVYDNYGGDFTYLQLRVGRWLAQRLSDEE